MWKGQVSFRTEKKNSSGTNHNIRINVRSILFPLLSPEPLSSIEEIKAAATVKVLKYLVCVLSKNGAIHNVSHDIAPVRIFD